MKENAESLGALYIYIYIYRYFYKKERIHLFNYQKLYKEENFKSIKI